MRWGTELHDRFLLAHYVAGRHRRGASTTSRATAIAFDHDVARRRSSSSASPASARSTIGGVTLELRAAIEPWLVLGEEVTATGTARYVDSSVERLQVARRRASPPGRHVVTCNGVPVPLQRDRRARRDSSPACATGPGSRRRRCTRRSGCTRRSCSTSSTAGTAARSAAAPTTSCTPAAGPTTASRSTPTRPRPAGPAASSRSATRPGALDVRRRLDRRMAGGRRVPSAPWTCGAPPGLRARPAGADPSTADRRSDSSHDHHRSPDLLDRYRPLAGPYDEMLDADGALRAHWTHVGQRARRARASTSSTAAAARPSACSTTTASPTTSTASRPRASHRAVGASTRCRCCSSSDEWAAHRARRDPAGRAARPRPRRPLRAPRPAAARGCSRPSSCYGHPGFLRAVRPDPPPRARRSSFNAAFDLARDERRRPVRCSPTAPRRRRARATRSRTGSSSRGCFPSLYRDAEVHRLAPFFRALRAALAGRRRRRAPTIPASSCSRPGPLSETAFEHAFLARYLGYPLVEGADLTVQRRPGVAAVARPPRAGRRDPAPGRRRGTATRSSCGPTRSSACPGWSRRARRGHRVGRQPARQRRAREPRPAAVPAASSPRTCSARTCACRRSPTWWCGDDTRAPARARQPRRARDQADRPRSSGVRPPSSAGTLDADERDELRRRDRGPTRAAGSARSAWRSPSAPTLDRRRPRGPPLRAAHLRRRPRRLATRRCPAASPGSRHRRDGGRSSPTRPAALSKDTWVLASEPETLTGFWLHGRAQRRRRSSPRARCRPAPPRTCSGSAATPSGPRALVRLLRVVHDRRNEFQHGTNPAGTECLHVLLARAHPRHHDLPRLRRRRRRRAARRTRRRAALAGRRRATAPARLAYVAAPDARRRPRRARPAVERHLARDRQPRPRPRRARRSSADTRSAAPADAEPRAAEPARPGRPRRREHGARPGLAVHGRRPAHRAGDAARRPARRHRHRPSATPRPTACCSSRC